MTKLDCGAIFDCNLFVLDDLFLARTFLTTLRSIPIHRRCNCVGASSSRLSDGPRSQDAVPIKCIVRRRAWIGHRIECRAECRLSSPSITD